MNNHKLTAVFLVCALALSMTACGGSSNSSKIETSSVSLTSVSSTEDTTNSSDSASSSDPFNRNTILPMKRAELEISEETLKSLVETLNEKTFEKGSTIDFSSISVPDSEKDAFTNLIRTLARVVMTTDDIEKITTSFTLKNKIFIKVSLDDNVIKFVIDSAVISD